MLFLSLEIFLILAIAAATFFTLGLILSPKKKSALAPPLADNKEKETLHSELTKQTIKLQKKEETLSLLQYENEKLLKQNDLLSENSGRTDQSLLNELYKKREENNRITEKLTEEKTQLTAVRKKFVLMKSKHKQLKKKLEPLRSLQEENEKLKNKIYNLRQKMNASSSEEELPLLWEAEESLEKYETLQNPSPSPSQRQFQQQVGLTNTDSNSFNATALTEEIQPPAQRMHNLLRTTEEEKSKLQQKIQIQKGRLRELQINNRQLETHVETLEQQLDKAQNNHSSLNKKHHADESRSRNLLHELNTAQESTQRIRARLKKIYAENLKLREEIRKLEKEKQTLQSQYQVEPQNTQENETQLKQQLEKSEGKIQALNQKIDHSQEETRYLKQKIEELSKNAFETKEKEQKSQLKVNTLQEEKNILEQQQEEALTRWLELEAHLSKLHWESEHLINGEKANKENTPFQIITKEKNQHAPLPERIQSSIQHCNKIIQDFKTITEKMETLQQSNLNTKTQKDDLEKKQQQLNDSLQESQQNIQNLQKKLSEKARDEESFLKKFLLARKGSHGLCEEIKRIKDQKQKLENKNKILLRSCDNLQSELKKNASLLKALRTEAISCQQESILYKKRYSESQREVIKMRNSREKTPTASTNKKDEAKLLF